jgi:hypothetical protein
MQMRRLGYLFMLVITITFSAKVSFAQDGKLKIKVSPAQAYVFADGKAIREGSHSIPLSAGKHTIVVVNYGYKMSTQDVTIESGKTTDLAVTLQAYGDKVAGPFGRIMIEFKPEGKAAVLLNGKKPDYFVGNVDEFNHDWWWHQELLVPPGTHQVTIMDGDKEVYNGSVTVEANKKTLIHVTQNGKVETKDWSRSAKIAKMSPLPRFTAGLASATVAVAAPTASFSASPTQINCGQSSTLTWQSTDTVDANINGIGAVATSGNQSVTPHATTPYDFSAVGPGGTAKGSGTVNVNTAVTASLSANPTELHYRKIGDKVLTQDSSTLTWQTGNADNVMLSPGGAVQPSGTQTVKPDPSDTSQVPDGGATRTINESKPYTLTATNVCGGTSTQTASLHITGTVEPIPAVTLESIFYPTDYPDKKNPQVGLVKSQQLELATLAGGFKKYLEYDPDAKLSIEAHADARASKSYNQDLSERRVERIKGYLVEQGISADKVETAAYGKDQPLANDVVQGLETSNPQPPPKARARAKRVDWLAYNRRADIILMPSGKKSTQYFPHGADDSGLIWQLAKPPLKKVQAAE